MAENSRDPAMTQLRHFLYLGDVTKAYPESITYPFESERIQGVFSISGSEEDAIREILRMYRDGFYLALEPIIYALAVFAHSKQVAVKHSAIKAAKEICISASSMFTFTHFYKELAKPSKGWGRSHRNFLNSWYNGKDSKDLAVEVTKTKSKFKWTHKDILCMGHVKPTNPGSAAVYRYAVKGFENAEKDFTSESEAEPILKYLKAIHEVNHAQDAETVARLIESHDLCLDRIPTKFIKTKEVSLCLIPRVPIKILLTLIPQFCKAGLLKLNSTHYKALLERLGSEDVLNDSSVDPLETFLAIRRWQLSNRIVPGKSMMRQNTPAIDDALQNLHQASFKSIAPTQKRYIVAVDIRPCMSQTVCGSCKCVTPSNVSEIVLLALVKAELSNVTVLAFSTEELVQVDINNKMTISDVKEHLSKAVGAIISDEENEEYQLTNQRETLSPYEVAWFKLLVSPGDVNLCAVPQWAITRKRPCDLFLVLTHTAAGYYQTGWIEALKEYKDTLRLPNTRYLTASLADRKIEALEDDPYTMNIIGFNVKLLKIIQDFASGNI